MFMTRLWSFLAILTCWGAVVATASPALASPQAYQIASSTPPRACTYLAGGDREFNGNGPSTRAIMYLRLSSSGYSITTDATLEQRETKADWTTGYATTSATIGYAPASTSRFTFVWAPDGSTWRWWAISPGIVRQTTLVYTDTNTNLEIFYNFDWWLDTVNIMGDTTGSDISNGCPTPNTDSWMTYKFTNLWFWAE